MGDAEYIAAFHQVVMPIATAFCPELVLISAGFDAARGDPLGGCSLTPYGYATMTAQLCTLAAGRVVLALEGGYNLASIATSAEACARVFLGDAPPLPPIRLAPPAEGALCAIKQTILAQCNFWPCLPRPTVEKKRTHPDGSTPLRRKMSPCYKHFLYSRHFRVPRHKHHGDSKHHHHHHHHHRADSTRQSDAKRARTGAYSFKPRSESEEDDRARGVATQGENGPSV
mmetsp:Transcript_32998/g.77408  ORF Transcript_32998/g.77408 Transcript_32998/m.77408 type:complete len:228 (-) Transcript_32998:22-705(-)